MAGGAPLSHDRLRRTARFLAPIGAFLASVLRKFSSDPEVTPRRAVSEAFFVVAGFVNEKLFLVRFLSVFVYVLIGWFREIGVISLELFCDCERLEVCWDLEQVRRMA